MIEGIPDGWEPVRFDYANDGESFLGGHGEILVHLSPRPTQVKRLIIRKIEKPKQYRPFANGDEFLSHHLHDGWVKLMHTSFTKVSQFEQKRFWVNGEEACYTWVDGFDLLKFRDGTPFGIEVTE